MKPERGTAEWHEEQRRKGARIRGGYELTESQRANLPRIIGRKPEATAMVVAVLGGQYEAMGLVRTVKHRDHTRSYELTSNAKAAIAEVES